MSRISVDVLPMLKRVDRELLKRVRRLERLAALERFAEDCLDPEMYGHTLSGEIRDRARLALGLPAVESVSADGQL